MTTLRIGTDRQFRILDCRLWIVRATGISIYNSQSTIRNPQWTCGFTLIELVIVAVVLGILLVGASPRFQQGIHHLQTERTAHELSGLLRYARERSIAERQIIRWVWNDSENRAHLERVQGGERATPIDERLAQSSVFSKEISVQVSWAEQPISWVDFFPDGTSDPAIMNVSHQRTQRTQTVAVDAATGQIMLVSGVSAR